MKWNIGNIVTDEDGCTGIVGIRYTDGDFCTIENDAAHPNPMPNIGRDVFTGKWLEQDAAKIAYRTYNETINEQAPEWAELSDKIQQAWCRAMIEVKKSYCWYGGAFGPSMADA